MTDARTGVEMEAMVAVSAAALTIYDMAKAIDRAMEIGAIRLVAEDAAAAAASSSAPASAMSAVSSLARSLQLSSRRWKLSIACPRRNRR